MFLFLLGTVFLCPILIQSKSIQTVPEVEGDGIIPCTTLEDKVRPTGRGFTYDEDDYCYGVDNIDSYCDRYCDGDGYDYCEENELDSCYNEYCDKYCYCREGYWDHRWAFFKLQLDENLTPAEEDRIVKVVNRLSNLLPCVPFRIFPANEIMTEDYVRLVKGDVAGCWSQVGRQGGEQVLHLGPECMAEYIVTHELLHALGIPHEQSRWDRDDYVTIEWDNIRPEYISNFQKLTYSESPTYGVPYNLNSIMHYSPYLFSKNNQPTITAKNGTTNFGRSMRLQPTDIMRLQRMYDCLTMDGLSD